MPDIAGVVHNQDIQWRMIERRMVTTSRDEEKQTTGKQFT
jgi:hypothetical protein